MERKCTKIERPFKWIWLNVKGYLIIKWWVRKIQGISIIKNLRNRSIERLEIKIR